MKKRWGVALSVLLTATLPAADAEQVTATVLQWQEQEAGIEPYPTRMFVNAKYLRTDDGEDSGGFMLFERDTNRIYSVSHLDRSVLVFEHQPLPPTAGPRPPVRIESDMDEAAPRVAGRPVSHLRLMSGDQLCLQAAVVPGLLPDVTEALRGLSAALAGRQYRDLDRTPEDYRTPCFLVNYVFESERVLEAGFPIQESDASGRARILIDFETEQQVPAELFTLPADYRRQQLP